jgi:hypothetical protein
MEGFVGLAALLTVLGVLVAGVAVASVGGWLDRRASGSAAEVRADVARYGPDALGLRYELLDPEERAMVRAMRGLAAEQEQHGLVATVLRTPGFLPTTRSGLLALTMSGMAALALAVVPMIEGLGGVVAVPVLAVLFGSATVAGMVALRAGDRATVTLLVLVLSGFGALLFGAMLV